MSHSNLNHELGEIISSTEALFKQWRGESGVVFATLNLLMHHSRDYSRLYQKIYKNFYTAIHAAIACGNPALPADERAVRTRLPAALIDGAAMQAGVSRNTSFQDAMIAEALRISGCDTQ